METTRIDLGGLSNEPNDYKHEEGDLSLSVNAVKHNGSIRVVQQGKSTGVTLNELEKLMYIHTLPNSGEVRYVCRCTKDDDYTFPADYVDDGTNTIYNKNGICWFSETDKKRVWLKEFDDGVEVYAVTAVKNILVISTSTGLLYARNNGTGYKWLGSLPKLPYVEPYLTAKFVDSDCYGSIGALGTVTISGLEEGVNYTPANAADGSTGILTNVYNQVFAIINKLRKEIHKEGRFAFPFMVRVAYRMFDGNYIAVSRPHLMCPSSTYAPFVAITGKDGEEVSFDAFMASCQLSLYVGTIEEDWKDLITGVDIFASPESVDFTDSEDGIDNILYSKDNSTFENELPFCISKNDPDVISEESFKNNRNIVNYYKDHYADTYRYVTLLRSVVRSDRQYGYTIHSSTTYHDYIFIEKINGYDSPSYFNVLDLSGNNWTDQYITSGKTYEDLKAQFGDQIDNFYVYNLNGTVNYAISPNGETIKIYIYRHYFDSANQFTPSGIVRLRRTDGRTGKDALMQESAFYKIGSIDFEDVSSTRVYTPELSNDEIDNLTGKTVLDASVINAYPFTCKDIYVYNSRLNVAVADQGFEDGDYLETFYTHEGDASGMLINKAYVEIVKNGVSYLKELKFETSADNCKLHTDQLRYFFYSNINAIRLVLVLDTKDSAPFQGYVAKFTHIENEEEYYFYYEDDYFPLMGAKDNLRVKTITLKKHDTLPGVYAFNNWETLELSNVEAASNHFDFMLPKEDDFEKKGITNYPSTGAYQKFISLYKDWINTWSQTDISSKNEYLNNVSYESGDSKLIELIESDSSTFHVGNKILQSDVNNPFCFLNETTVGLDYDIHKVLSTTLPISQGQFGSYPLYVFTSGGVYALAVGSDGTYESVQPVSQDILINEDSVTQLNQSILFVTKRGLMELAGGDINCICEALKGHNLTENIDKIANVKSVAGIIEDQMSQHIETWLNSACLLFDYKRQLIYAYHPATVEKNYGLVYSMLDGTWGMYENRLAYNVTSFTDALAVDKDSNLINMSEDEDTFETELHNLLIVTRPLTFGYDDLYKTLETLLVKGVFDDGEVMVVVWASNNLKDWRIIGSSKSERWRNYSGTPYKYFRIGIIGKELEESDSINSINVGFTPRLTNKLR